MPTEIMNINKKNRHQKDCFINLNQHIYLVDHPVFIQLRTKHLHYGLSQQSCALLIYQHKHVHLKFLLVCLKKESFFFLEKVVQLLSVLTLFSTACVNIYSTNLCRAQ